MDAYMQRAIELGGRAGLGERESDCGGAVVVRENGEVVGEGYTCVVREHDPTAHGEVRALRAACRYLCTHELPDCAMFVSSEPCLMCKAAIALARVPIVYIGCSAEDAAMHGGHDPGARAATTKYVLHSPAAAEAMASKWRTFGERRVKKI